MTLDQFMVRMINFLFFFPRVYLANVVIIIIIFNEKKTPYYIKCLSKSKDNNDNNSLSDINCNQNMSVEKSKCFFPSVC